MDSSLIQALEITALPASILCGTAVVALVRWAKAQKAIENNATLETVLNYVEEAAESIVASLKTLPEGANANLIRNTIIQQAADNIMSSQHLLLKKADIGKPALMAMIDTRVISHGSGTVVPPAMLKMKVPSGINNPPLTDDSNQPATTHFVQAKIAELKSVLESQIGNTKPRQP